MLTTNELPDIYGEKKSKEEKKEEKIKKKVKKKKYYVHKETNNLSFLKMYKTMKLLGIDYDEYLSLYDTRLIDIDPFDPDLTAQEKIMVLAEVKRNYWYFIREIVRIQSSGADIGNGGGDYYKLHRGNLAMSWCFLNSIDFFVELPRQNYKTYSIMVIMTWLYNFGTTNSQMMLLHKDHRGSKDNLSTIKKIRDGLPEYLRFKTISNAKGDEIGIPENVESIENPRTHNSIKTFASATSNERADLLGRGATQPVQNYDEFGFMRFNMTIYEAASPAANEAAEAAEAHGKIHCKMISTTPGDMNTDYGRDALEFRDKGYTFNEDMYTEKISDVKARIKANSTNGFVNIKYSYQELGRSQEYFDKVVTALGGNKLKIRREILLEWLIINEDPVFDEEALSEIVKTAENRKYQTIYIDKIYELDLYKPIPKDRPVIISCDVAGGDARDNSAITIIDTRTKEIIGEFENNKIDTVEFSFVIHTIATKIAPNCLIVIERNNVGVTVITNLRKTDVKSKLYYENTSKEDYQDKLKKGNIQEAEASEVRNFGVWTSEDKKVQMQETLVKYVNHYGYRVSTKKMAAELNTLIYNKKRVIDHPPNGHDDLVMAYNIGMWVYWHGKNLQRWGIFQIPDVDPHSDKTEDDLILEQMEKEEEKRERINNVYSHVKNDYNGKETVKFDKFKSISDYYNECDLEMNRELDKGYNGKTNINNLYKNKRNNGMFNSGRDSDSDSFANSLVNDILGKDF